MRMNFTIILVCPLFGLFFCKFTYSQNSRFTHLAESERMVFQSWGVPACPDPVTVTQPDGTEITITGHGDGAVHWYTTSDGYTVLRNREGNFEYAKKDDQNNLVLSGIKAYDPGQRRLKSANLLKSIDKDLRYSTKQVDAKLKSYSLAASQSGPSKAFPNEGSPRLLVILINFADATNNYSREDFENYMNQDNFSGTGSVKQYFYEASYGRLSLQIDVVGWVTSEHPHDYYGENDSDDDDMHPRELVMEALKAVDAEVDFSQYDNDGDGNVDGVSIIHQGTGEEVGADGNDIWSHSWGLSGLYSRNERTFDGVAVNQYTIQPERKNATDMNTIGVMCHEFGHNLGAPDFYDTDYDESGGKYEGTGRWDLMGSGTYNGSPSGSKPAHPNMFIKTFYYNWLSPVELTSQGTYSMQNSEENKVAYYFSTQSANEYYLLENRQQIGSDAGIPGHGLLIYHVDQDHIEDHDNSNDINVSSHQGLYLKDADNDGTINDSDCPYPYEDNNEFTDKSTPNSLSWAGESSNSPLTNIEEKGGVITFDFLSSIPLNFEANAVSQSEIEISWQLNVSSDPVLLVWSSSPTIGEPEVGLSYSAGESIPGGGTVLYEGSEISYMHAPLIAGAKYYYKIWAKHESGEYSEGLMTDEATMRVKLMADGFESYTDFTKAFGGWTLVDVDGSNTYGISGIEFANAGSQMAYMVFNPSQTSPASSSSWTAHSGEKYAACFAATTPTNNDWLISPQINIGSNAMVSFWAQSITDQYGLERFNVLVSTTGTDPEDFTKISEGNYVEAPTSWTQYQYDLNSFAGNNIYVAVQCVSNDAFCFLVDDFEVSSSGPVIANWTGDEDTDWNNPGNWNPAVPLSFTDVTIANGAINYPVIENLISCKSLVVEDGASLSVGFNGVLSVEENLTNNAGNAGITIYSSAEGTGQIFNHSEGVEVSIKQIVKRNKRLNFSSPVAGAQTGIFADYDLRSFDESDGKCGNWYSIDDSTLPLSPGKGFDVFNRGEDDDTITIEGTLNNGDIAITPDYTSDNHGWNYIGNPYACAINWNSSSITKNNIDQAIYVWNDTLNGGNGQFVVYNNDVCTPEKINGGTNNIIAPMQGFFVRANDVSAGITLSNVAKVVGNNDLKKVQALPLVIRLRVEDENGYGDETVIRSDTQSTEEFDSAFDAYKRFHPQPVFPEIYSVDATGKKLSINCIPVLNEGTKIDLLVESPNSGVVEVGLQHGIQDWNSDLPVLLIDTRTNTSHNLIDGNASIMVAEGEEVPMKLVFADISVDLKKVLSAELRVIAQRQKLIVNTGQYNHGWLELYDLSGRKILSRELEGDMHSIDTNLDGVFIVILSAGEEQKVEKVILRY